MRSRLGSGPRCFACRDRYTPPFCLQCLHQWHAVTSAMTTIVRQWISPLLNKLWFLIMYWPFALVMNKSQWSEYLNDSISKPMKLIEMYFGRSGNLPLSLTTFTNIMLYHFKREWCTFCSFLWLKLGMFFCWTAPKKWYLCMNKKWARLWTSIFWLRSVVISSIRCFTSSRCLHFRTTDWSLHVLWTFLPDVSD